MKRSSSSELTFESLLESQSDQVESPSTPTQDSPTPTKTPTSSRKKAKPSPPSSSKSKKLSPTTPRGKLLAAIISAGVKSLDRAATESDTGLKPAQQRELMREDGKGALYNAVVKFAEGLQVHNINVLAMLYGATPTANPPLEDGLGFSLSKARSVSSVPHSDTD